MATPTYTAIASITLGSSASSVTFSSIPQDYRDLVLVAGLSPAAGNFGLDATINGISSGFTNIRMFAQPSSNTSDITTNNKIMFGSDNSALAILEIFDYSVTDKNKTMLEKNSRAGTSPVTLRQITRWANTSAITSIQLAGDTQNFAAGSTFALYGIIS